ncbi:protein brambleberry-like [Melospiza melodia melodia]|uniref:protein brambleberry-like n=1 Tax=Melospiza melodia melodia TaxID=1914991 RepID=UPI002FCEBBB7
MWEVLPTLPAPQVPPPAGIHGTPSIPIMLLQSSWAVLLLCATAGFWGWLGLAAHPEKEELWETWMRSALDEIPVAQLVQDIAHRMGNMSSRGAAELQGGHQVVPSNLHQEQERPQDVHPQPESILVLQEVMEKLQKVNQSLELVLTALEDAQSRLEKHLEHLKAIPDPDGQSQSVTSSCIPHSSYFTLLVLPLVPASFQAIFLLLFLASSALGIPAISTLLVLAAAGHWLLASGCRGAGRIRPVVPREKARYRLTSTPERECDMELLQEELDRMEMSCLQNERCPQEPSHLEQPQEVARDIPKFTGQVSPDPDGQRTTPSSCGVTPEPVMDAGKLLEPKACTPRANMSPCQGLTRAGQRCRKKAIPGLEFCHIHTTSSSSAMDSSPRF